MEKKRLDYLDLAKGIGIILVVIAHSTLTSDAVQAYITAFHMPLFFIVSGMLICHNGEENKEFGSTVRRKLRTIMVPYLAFTVAYLLIDIIDMYLGLEVLTWRNIVDSVIEFLTLYGMSVLWFLPALFFGELLFIGWKKQCDRWKYGGKVMIASGVLSAILMPAGSFLLRTFYLLYENTATLWIGYYMIVILRSLGAFTFLTIGYYGYRFYFEESDRKDEGGQPGTVGCKEVVCGILCLLLTGIISRLNGIVDMHYLVFGNPVLYYLGTVMGTFGVVLLCRHWFRFRALRYLGSNSLIIMATHLDFQVMYYGHCYAYWANQFITRAKVYVLCLNVALMVTLLELVLIFIINRWMPFMVGRKAPKG